jgi:hypothetical protein
MSDSLTLWDGSTFFSLDGARKFAKFALDLGVKNVAIVIDVSEPGLELVGLKLDYIEKTGRGSRTRQSSSHVQNPEAFSIWAEMTEVAP